jgi:hypothetical protein
MPSLRLQWHLARCPAKKNREREGLPTFHCKHNYLHIFFEQTTLFEHEANCEYAKSRETQRLEII